MSLFMNKRLAGLMHLCCIGMDNKTLEEAMVYNVTSHSAPVYLKQSVPMMVVYTLAYSAVFVLGTCLYKLLPVRMLRALLFLAASVSQSVRLRVCLHKISKATGQKLM